MKEALVAAGHDVVDWEPIDHELHWKILVNLYFEPTPDLVYTTHLLKYPYPAETVVPRWR